MKLNRIDNLSDGIFAIAMTILVLQLQVPVIHIGIHGQTLADGLFRLWPKALSYGGSFLILGIYWVGQHRLLDLTKRLDTRFIWTNIFFLMWIALIPFSTALIGSYPGHKLALIVYGTNLLMCSLSLFLGWRYATSRSRLIAAGDVTGRMRQIVRRRVLIEPLVYVIGIGCTFIDVRLAIVFFVVPPLLSFLPSKSSLHTRQYVRRIWQRISS